MSDLISIIIPTYNESKVIEPLVNRIHAALAGRSYEIVVVDDDSPDGTAAAARLMSGRFPVKVVVRTAEKGLATAVVEGFKYASGDLLVVMDADLQHPPEAIGGLVGQLESGADVAVASRYVPGAYFPGLNTLRKLISRGATAIAHLMLPQSRVVSDPMGGFFAFRRGVIDGAELHPLGFKILLEVLVRGRYGKVVEIPITFSERGGGESKLNLRQQCEYLKHVLSLMKRSGELKRFLSFCAVGSSGVGVNLGILWLLTEIGGLYYVASAALSIEAAIVSNFLLNNFFTFADRGRKGIINLLQRLLRFNVISLAGVGVNLLFLWLFTSCIGLHYLVSQCFGIVMATIWNYLANNWWTWSRYR